MAKKDRKDITLRSDEIQDLMQRKPTWMIRYGTTLLAALILLGLFFTWLIKYPDLVVGPVTITSANPPVKVVCQTNGKITKLNVAEGDSVNAGDILAEIENPVSSEAIIYLKVYIERLNSALENGYSLPIPDTVNVNFGELQPLVVQLKRDITNSNLRLDFKMDEIAIKQLQLRIADQKELIKINEHLLEIEKKRFENAKVQYSIDQELFIDSVITKSDFIKRESEFRQMEQALELIALTHTQYKIELNDMIVQLARLQFGKTEADRSQLDGILSLRESISNQINIWKQRFTLTAPNSGIITFLQPLYEDQFVRTDEVYMAIMRRNPKHVGWVTISTGGYGKVEEGQRVNVMLDNYPFHEYGLLRGLVGKKSTMPNGLSYIVEIEFPHGMTTTYGENLAFAPDMLGEAEIITKDRRLIQRIFESLVKLMNRKQKTKGE
jgi:HlyD family secretion protein